ncbi:hypothetical protein ACLK1V_23735 [Escherichia coli]
MILFLGNSTIAMLISLLFAIYTMGLGRGKTIPDLMDSCGKAIAGIAGLLLIIGGGGAFKKFSSTLALVSTLPPWFPVWILTRSYGLGVAAFLRICLGSATVAAIPHRRSGHPIVGSRSQYQPGLDHAGYRCRILYLFSR